MLHPILWLPVEHSTALVGLFAASCDPGAVRPRLGVLAYGPIQYHAPLYQRLADRGAVDLDVLFLSDAGHRATTDPGFGVSVAWDIDLLSGYAHSFLTTAEQSTVLASSVATVAHWIPRHDAVVVNGYTDPWMLLAMIICRTRRIPYLLRGSSHPQGQSAGLRRHLRRFGARMVVSGSAGGLAMGTLNHEFYRTNGARRIVFAPNSVDNDRIARTPNVARSALLARWGLDGNRPVIVFCGKLIQRKRPLDLVAAIKLMRRPVTTLFVGDGALSEPIRASLPPGTGAVTGFVNQSALRDYYHAADVLVLPSEVEAWGLVVNEAMAAGALPVVSDRVGSAPDLVAGVGEVYPCGDVEGLAAALDRALVRAEDPATRDRVRRRVDGYSLDITARGFEQAALAASEEAQ